ncbi:hypothetical protein C8N46_102504 [Kordia periserrulae]|uniref:Uncharacterized protein n=1 Tax=Kordia periserrulae TaxID=701523 RepID=A0A2T6C444_9FLAO|nr:hypothetical protein [Kordia periserrulae]PTX63101.1 hypothetical protein C8N46_102504 [Kordia periserrulae]
MKTKNLKSLALNKKAIANISSNEVKGGLLTTTFTTIGDLTKSCPQVCGSQK